MFVAEICDECLLGADFLSSVNFDEVLKSFFEKENPRKKEILSCSRISENQEFFKENQVILKELLENNSEKLDANQKEMFSVFLKENCSLFSENIVAGNCDVYKHVINVKDSPPHQAGTSSNSIFNERGSK